MKIHNKLGLTVLIGFLCWVSTGSNVTAEDSQTTRLRMLQQTPDCSDVDVVPAGWKRPAFRLLLPEHVWLDEGSKRHDFGAHCTVGRWEKSEGELSGVYRLADKVEITVKLSGRDNTVDIQMGFRNLTSELFRQVRIDICASVNHLPGKPDWSNGLFFPKDVPENREIQGRYWFQHVTPRRERALRPDGWIVTHRSPDNPDPDQFPSEMNFQASKTADTIAYAAQSRDGKWLYFQTWDRPCQHTAPFPGNACMHLYPLVAERLEPGATVEIHGRAGLFHGDWDGLRKDIQQWQAAQQPTKTSTDSRAR